MKVNNTKAADIFTCIKKNKLMIMVTTMLKVRNKYVINVMMLFWKSDILLEISPDKCESNQCKECCIVLL